MGNLSNSEKAYIFFLVVLAMMYGAYVYFDYTRKVSDVIDFDHDAWEKELRRSRIIRIALCCFGVVLGVLMMLVGLHFSIKFW